MAGLIVGRITAQLGLDDTGFASGVRRAGSSMQQLGQQTRQSEQAISSAMKSAVSEVDRYAAKVAQARANQAAAAARAEKAERQLQAAQNAGNADKAADAELRLAQARARLTTASIATQEAAAGLAEANNQAAESSDGASESITNMGDSSDTTAGKLAAMAAGAIGAGAAMSKILTVGMDFTTSLNTMQAVSGATSAQMKDVSAAAKALGGDITLPGTSANNAAAAMTELAKGGFSVQQSMDAAKGTLQLAAAAQIEAGDAATIQSQALQAFGANATYASEAADILSNASNASSAEITDVAAALQQAGTVAAGFGVSMADTATMIGLFANAGITGSDAGTLLKTSLQSLTDQGAPAQQAIKDLGLTVYNANGEFVGMRSLWDQLSQASTRMSDEQFQAATNILFGSDAMRTAMVAAGGGTAAYDKMAAAINKQGTAAQIAAAKTQGLPGAWERVQNSIEGVALTTYSMIEGPLTSLANSGASIIGTADGMASSLGFIVAPIAALAAGFASIPGPMQTVITLLIAGRIAMAAFGTQINSARNYASNAAGVMRGYGTSITNMQRAATVAGGSMNRLSASIAVLGRNNATIAAMGASYLRASGQASNFARVQGTAAAATVGMRGAIGGLTGALGGPWGIAIMGAIGLLTLWMSKKREDATASAETEAATKSWADALDESGGAITRAIREKAANEAADKKMITGFEKLGIASNQVVDGVLGQGDALGVLRRRLDEVIEANTKIETVDGAKSGMQSTKKVYNETAKSAQDLKNNLNEMHGEFENGKSRAMQVAEATGDVKRSIDGTVTAVGPLSEAMVEFQESTDGAASKVDKLAKALTQLDDDELTQEEALQQWSNDMRDFAKALEDGGAATIGLNGHIDVTNEKGSALQDTVQQMTADFNQMAVATYEAARAQGKSMPEALQITRDAMQGYRQSFVDAAVASGKTVDEANRLADAYNLIPNDKVLKLNTEGITGATAALTTLAGKVATLPEGQFKIADNTPEVRAKLEEMKVRFSIIDGKVVITDNTGEVSKALSAIGVQTTTLPGGYVKIEDTSEQNLNHLRDIGIKTETLPDGSVVVNVNDVDAQRRLAELTAPKDKVINVKVNDPAGLVYNPNIGGSGAAREFHANGAIRQYAAGGVNAAGQSVTREPMIARGGANILWGEKETGWEAYISGKPSELERNKAIWFEAGKRLGIVQMENGGIATVGGLKNYMRGIEGAQYGYGAWGQGWTTDCSGGQSIAMNYADGLNDQPGTGARAGTATFDSYTAGHGLQPGSAPAGVPAYEVTWNPEHTAGTIIDPVGGDVNIEMGGARGDGQYDGPDGSRSLSGSTAWMPLQGDPGAAGQIGAPDTRTAKQKNIDTVIAEGKRRGESDKEIKSAVMAVLAETGGENLDHGMDGDNAGVLSQRPSWGTVEQRMDPAYAANAYYDAANKVEGAEGMTEAQLAQAVQRSGTADGSNYAAKEAEADAEIAASMTRSTTTQTGSATSGSGEPVFVTNWPSQLTTTTTSTSSSSPATSGADSESTTGPEKLGNIGPLAISAYARGAIEDRAPGSAQVLNREHIWLTQAGEAGPESYIPLNGSPRSKALWLETGRHLGMMDSYAAGGFAGYSEDTSDALKPKNFYDWAALVAGGGFAVASAVTPYLGMASGGQVTLGDLAPTVDTSANSIDGISQALGASADELKEVLIAILQATRENKKVKATLDSGVMDGLTPALSAAGL
ncbi:phage tail tape measure protein [Williamsia sp. DF01-3]|uniref:phage tail tape measure protein n=1 Tax=Williamsia sp. DF01-3 TaxID=2934157 RepID=UPI001FF69BD8|nr:phage tail tape measure protein [Williamsia sp. DF01-3]MCK0517866.1 phage tail tape measure protein [Williamsia sp. DF01-3]